MFLIFIPEEKCCQDRKTGWGGNMGVITIFPTYWGMCLLTFPCLQQILPCVRIIWHSNSKIDLHAVIFCCIVLTEESISLGSCGQELLTINQIKLLFKFMVKYVAFILQNFSYVHVYFFYIQVFSYEFRYMLNYLL